VIGKLASVGELVELRVDTLSVQRLDGVPHWPITSRAKLLPKLRARAIPHRGSPAWSGASRI
jgi:hypothetical protein